MTATGGVEYGAGDFPGSSTTTTSGFVQLYAPFLFHVAPHFFLGAGPGFYRSFGTSGDSADVTRVFGRFQVGFWWGGPRRGAVAEPERERPCFGEGGHWVFTGEENSSVTGRTSSPNQLTVAFRPGADVFVARHLSVGASFSYASTSNLTEWNRSYGGGPRVGFDLPLGESRFSFYPRLGALFSHTASTSKVASLDVNAPIDTGATVVSLDVFAPFLFHVAPHAFLGFGPSLTQEVLRHNDNGEAEKAGVETTVGADILVGGYL